MLTGRSKEHFEGVREEETRRIFSPVETLKRGMRHSNELNGASSSHLLAKDTEKVCRKWLSELEFTTSDLQFFSSSDEKFLYEDPCRNGVFLARLLDRVGLLASMSSTSLRILIDPRSIEECRVNLLTIVNLLGNLSISIAASSAEDCCEMLLAGNFNVFWSIVAAVKAHLDGPMNDRYR